MAYTLEDLNRLEEAIVKIQSGERVVQVAHDGHVVRYAAVELNDLIKQRDRMKMEVKLAGKARVRRSHIIASKGV